MKIDPCVINDRLYKLISYYNLYADVNVDYVRVVFQNKNGRNNIHEYTIKSSFTAHFIDAFFIYINQLANETTVEICLFVFFNHFDMHAHICVMNS